MPTVLIGCKLPAGLILEIVEPGKDDSGKVGVMPAPIGQRVTLKGGNSVPRLRNALNEAPMLPRYPFGLTTVDKDFWDRWYARNKEMPFVKNGLVFVAKDRDSAIDMAKDRREVKTGLEPLSPKVDPRDSSRGDERVTTGADPSMAKAMRANEQEIPDVA
jgi:hypothetical protein